ncbi:MAG: glutaredoxin [Gammaproteobacteria bacterium]|jgi:glutaredoxin
MKFFFRLLRWPLGQIIILIDWVTRPKAPVLVPERQRELDASTSSLKLYHFKQCPFCVKTRRAIHTLGLKIETRDARNDPHWNQELINEGGKYQVPCLRIAREDGSIEWLYESGNINRYLNQRFG